MNKNSIRLSALSMSAINAFAYGLASLYNNFVQIYIRGYHSTVGTGLLLSIGPVVAMAAPFLWGVLADRARSRKSILYVLMAGSAAGFALLGLSRSFAAMAVSLLAFMFFFSPLTGLADLLTVEGCGISGAKYGLCRVFGTLFYGILPLIIAPLTSGDINYIFIAFGIITVLCAFFTLPVPENASERVRSETPSAPKKKKRKTGAFVLALVRDRKLVMILLMLFAAHFSFGCVLIYYPEYLTSTLGLPQSAWAAVVMATVAGEIPLFLFYNKIVERLGLNRMLVIGVLLGALRMASYMVFKTALPIIVFSVFTGFGITLITYANLIYITQNYGRKRRATAMNFVYSLGVYGARVLAGVAAGGFVSAFGVPALMLGACVISAASFVFYIVYRTGGRTAPLPEDGEEELTETGISD